jgi:hypothetical protein
MKSWRIRRRLGAGDREGLAVVERLRFRGLGGGDCCAEGASRALKPDRRKCPNEQHGEVLPPFSLQGTHAVRFQRLYYRTAIHFVS